MSEVTKSSAVSSEIPSAVEAFAGSPRAPHTPHLPQADGAATPPADEVPLLDFLADLRKEFAGQLTEFARPPYAPLRRIAASFIGRMVTEAAWALDEVLHAPEELPEYSHDAGRRQRAAAACGREAVLSIPSTFGYVVTTVDADGNERFDRFVNAMEGEWDATKEAMRFVDGADVWKDDGHGGKFQRRVYEIGHVELTGKRLTKPKPAAKAVKRRTKAVAPPKRRAASKGGAT